jgi:hypothetical protein
MQIIKSLADFYVQIDSNGMGGSDLLITGDVAAHINRLHQKGS